MARSAQTIVGMTSMPSQTIPSPTAASPETTTELGPNPGQVDPNPKRAAFNAWFFDTMTRYINFATRHHKRAAFADLEPGRVLEIGAGTGANFGYLPSGTDLIALEPTLAMHDRLRANADEYGHDLEILAEPAESISLADGSVDTVVASLVLCTVTDPDVVLAEIRRVLRPGGTFRFIEHVAAPRWSPRHWVQRTVAKPWAWVFEGCDSCRPTEVHLIAAGFGDVQVTRRRFAQSFFFPVNSAIWGIATR